VKRLVINIDEVISESTWGKCKHVNELNQTSQQYRMPYVIVKVKDGYKVRTEERKADGKFHYFSKHGISKDMAERQRRALYAHHAK